MSKKAEEMAEEAERLHKEAYPELYEEETEDKTDDVPQETEEDQAQVDEPVQQDTKQTDEQDDWKQKYYVLKGKYDAEVPRLQHELNELKREVSSIVSHVKAEPKTEDEIPKELLDDPSIKYLAEEYPDVMKALVAFQKKVGDKSEVEQRISTVEKRQAASAEEKFVNDLNRLVPDWIAINKDSRFVDWLNQEDNLSGYSRYQLAMSHQNNLNASRVAAFYNEFKKEFGIENTDETQSQSANKKDMSKFVAPKTSSSGAINSKPNNDTITREFVTNFYRDASKGAFEGRLEEFNKIEARINKALIEGKIAE